MIRLVISMVIAAVLVAGGTASDLGASAEGFSACLGLLFDVAVRVRPC